MKSLGVIAVSVLLSLFVGLAFAVAGTTAAIVVVPAILALIVLKDYRASPIALILLFPLDGAPFIPRLPLLNPVNHLLLIGFVSLAVRRYLDRKPLLLMPKSMVFGIVLPLLLAVVNGLQYIDLGAQNMLQLQPGNEFTARAYVRIYVLNSFALILFSILLANAVADSKSATPYVAAVAVSACVVIAYVFGFTLASGVGWGAHRMVIGKAGMHYNDYGQLYALAFGPLLYLAFQEKGRAQFWYGVAACVVLVAVVLNFARAGMLAVLVTFVIFSWQRRSLRAILAVLVVLAAVVALAPEEWRSRMLQGANEIEGQRRGETYSSLTSGRVGGWIALLPDFLLSPIYGRGVGSTVWSTAVTAGVYPSVHPHNMYIQMLLDLGIIGTVAVSAFFAVSVRRFFTLAKDPSVEQGTKLFLTGAGASTVAMLILAVTGGDWYPRPSQAFLWASLGIALGVAGKVARPAGEARKPKARAFWAPRFKT